MKPTLTYLPFNNIYKNPQTFYAHIKSNVNNKILKSFKSKYKKNKLQNLNCLLKFLKNDATYFEKKSGKQTKFISLTSLL